VRCELVRVGKLLMRARWLSGPASGGGIGRQVQVALDGQALLPVAVPWADLTAVMAGD
jgi:hypothetical protein